MCSKLEFVANTRIYEKGTVKVVWIESDPNHIYAHMFDDVESARAFAANHPDSLIFTLDYQKRMTEFSWTLLKAGRQPVYNRLFRFYRHFRRLFNFLIRLVP